MEVLNKATKFFRKFVKDQAAFFLTEEPLDDKEEENKRVSICESNAGKCFNKKLRECRLCGCIVDNKAKALRNHNLKKFRIEVTHCPKGLWNDVEIANHYRKLDGKFLLNTKSE